MTKLPAKPTPSPVLEARAPRARHLSSENGILFAGFSSSSFLHRKLLQAAGCVWIFLVEKTILGAQIGSGIHSAWEEATQTAGGGACPPPCRHRSQTPLTQGSISVREPQQQMTPNWANWANWAA